MIERYLLIEGPAGGRTGYTDGADTIRVPIDGRYSTRDPFCHEYTRTDITQGGLVVFGYSGYVLFWDHMEFHPSRADLKRVELQLDWDNIVAPLLEAMGITIDSWASGYEYEGHGVDINRGNAYIEIHRNGDR